LPLGTGQINLGAFKPEPKHKPADIERVSFEQNHPDKCILSFKTASYSDKALPSLDSVE
jgi:hypothetical protein